MAVKRLGKDAEMTKEMFIGIVIIAAVIVLMLYLTMRHSSSWDSLFGALG